jgi:hypothetical protein
MAFMHRTPSWTVLVPIAIVCAACGGGASSSAPMAPSGAEQRETLSGVVTGANGAPLAAATVTVLDGPNFGAAAASDSAGHYQIPNLQAGTFSVQAAASGYQTLMKTVTLNANGALDFSLSKILKASLETVTATGSGVLQPDGTYAVPIVGRNAGDGCAGNVHGTADFSDATGVTRVNVPWSLPASTIVAPTAQFSFQVCCLAADVAFKVPMASVQYVYETVACPR